MFVISPTAAYFLFTCLLFILSPPSSCPYPSDFRIPEMILYGKVKLLLVSTRHTATLPIHIMVGFTHMDKNIDWFMHSRSGKFVVTHVIHMLVERKTVKIAQSFFNVLLLVGQFNFSHTLFTFLWWILRETSYHKIFRWAFSNLLRWALSFLAS